MDTVGISVVVRAARVQRPTTPSIPGVLDMNGYLMFLKSLSEYQQRAEIARLAFTERCRGSSLEEDILKTQAVRTVSEALGVNPCKWNFDLKHYAEEPDLFGPPVFCDDQCTAGFSFLCEHLNHSLLITGIIYIDDDQSAMIGTLTCSPSPSHQKSHARTRLVLAGINPDTLETVGHNVDSLTNYKSLEYRTCATRS
jgi:hypothetical protein